ncbi:dephospho-CoA kinase [Desulfofustis glycolicus]|uniref:Dephospho-CoA kinase n=1 Tax=Desulfofustis glycolicus DSM 9705 TaxID=1121409 RepID=A0A1M5W6G2_9BACT|nr:dephospho-CoA kinase [Desulfofustis glycolicus]MCB2217282.1 dephospho-CoA kinase [Desulfobulbaceae bacterium]SHH83060.1 dephospho-CoA kinase [Desulfofustis glycolicus DSM 9705]
MLIGITGTIGTGKSSVATLLGSELEAPVFSADQLCRDQLVVGHPGYRLFVEHFGAAFLERPEGPIDRARLRRAIFADEAARRELEAILHPLVRRELLNAGRAAGRYRCVVAEVPLLFESGWHDDFDFIVCVDAPRELVFKRVTARDAVPADQIERIMAAQLPAEQKRSQADWLIINDGDRAALTAQVARLADFLRSRFRIPQNRNTSSKRLDTPGKSTYKG